jgi:hypothetical protein
MKLTFQKNNFVLVIMFYGFQKAINHTWGSLLGNGLDHTMYSMCC